MSTLEVILNHEKVHVLNSHAFGAGDPCKSLGALVADFTPRIRDLVGLRQRVGPAFHAARLAQHGTLTDSKFIFSYVASSGPRAGLRAPRGPTELGRSQSCGAAAGSQLGVAAFARLQNRGAAVVPASLGCLFCSQTAALMAGQARIT